MTNGLWAVATYFNFCGFGSKYLNYLTFRSRLTVPLLTVELAEPGREELTERDADHVVHISAGDPMWQQHRLFNDAVRYLPDDCDFVVFLDADLVFADTTWPERVIDALGRSRLVQPFSTVTRLTPYQVPGTTTDLESRIAYLPRPSFVENRAGTTGIGWAMTREMAGTRPFYDASVMGGGDRLTAFAAVGTPEIALEQITLQSTHMAHYRDWAKRCQANFQGRLGAVSGTVYSLWHGSGVDRRYRKRHEEFCRFDFDPDNDVSISGDGAWIWASSKPEMHRYVRDYFTARQEDGRLLQGKVDGKPAMLLAL